MDREDVEDLLRLRKSWGPEDLFAAQEDEAGEAGGVIGVDGDGFPVPGAADVEGSRFGVEAVGGRGEAG